MPAGKRLNNVTATDLIRKCPIKRHSGRCFIVKLLNLQASVASEKCLVAVAQVAVLLIGMFANHAEITVLAHASRSESTWHVL